MTVRRSAFLAPLACAIAFGLGLGLASSPPADAQPGAAAPKKTRKQRAVDRHIYLAQYYLLREGDLDAAAREFQGVLRLDRDHVEAGLGLADIHMRKKDAKRAVKTLEDLTRRRKLERDTRVWQALGNARLEAGDQDGALAAWRRAIALNPRDEGTHWQVFSNLESRFRARQGDLAAEVRSAAEAYLNVARYKQGPNVQRAERTLVELSGDPLALTVFDARAAYRAAFEDASLGSINRKMGEARRGFEQCVQRQPDNQECHFWLGMVYASVKASDHYDRAKAQEQFRRAAKLPEAHVELGRLHRRFDELDRAEQAFRGALGIDRDHQAALVELAVVHKLRGREKQAIGLLVRAFQRDMSSSVGARALDELSKIDPNHELVRRTMLFGKPAGDLFSSDRFVGAVELVEQSLGGVDRRAPEQRVLEQVLTRIMDVADMDSRYQVRIAVLKSPIVNALALPNGNIYFTRGMLDQLKRQAGGKPITADNDVLGFVMGHELAHVIRGHVLQSMLFREAISDASRPLDHAVLTHVTRLHEMEADRVGMVLSFLAGYHPRGGIHFMELEGKKQEIPPHLDHPSWEQRVHYLEEFWSNDVKYGFLSFRFGVDEMNKARRYEGLDLGRAKTHYEQAVEHFRRFRNTLHPTKRVLNNLGVAYTKLGIFALTERGSPFHRWLTPLSIERETALKYVSVTHDASLTRGRRAGKADDPPPPRELDQAVSHFEEALRRDPNYGRARANLAAAQIAIGQSRQALASIGSLRAGRGVGSDQILLLRGIAHAELGEHALAARAFGEARKHKRSERAAAYNLARLYEVAGRKDQAKAAYRAFLGKWPQGAWATAARAALERL